MQKGTIMAWFEGFPFVSKEERARRQKKFERRLVPFGIEAQRDRAKETLTALFPDLDSKDSLFAFYDAKDAYTNYRDDEDKDARDGLAAATMKLRKLKWIDERKTKLLLAFIELESAIESLDDYPTLAQITAHAFPGETRAD
jgi:hypothetical protein